MKNICLFLLAALIACSQTPASLTPEEAVERALRQHPLMAAYRARVDAAQGQRLQASLPPNPRLYLQSENARVGGGATPFRFAQETDHFAYASQVLEAPGKRDSRLRLADAVILGRQLEGEAQRAAIARNVLSAYWAALGAEHVAGVLRNNLTNLERTVQYHRDRVREGAIAEVDLIRVDLEKEQVSLQFENAEQEARRLRSQLFREMGESTPHAVALTGDMRRIGPFLSPSFEETLTRRPDLRLARQLTDQAKTTTSSEQANAKPDPEVLFGYKRSSGFNTVIAGVQLSLPIRNRNQGSIATSLAEQRVAEHQFESAVLTARNEILSAQSEFEQKLRQLTEKLPKIREQAEDTARIARAVYREGAGDLLRLLDAERTGLQVELLYMRTLTEYHLTLVHLQAVTGMLP